MTKNKKRKYRDDIITLDMETTSMFDVGDGWESFDIEKHGNFENPQNHALIEKAGHMYIWGATVNAEFISGRTYHELLYFFESLTPCDDTYIIVWVHNLGFEFQWLLNLNQVFEVFARKARKPLKAVIEGLQIEFRCTYMLTDMSLYKASQNFCPHLLKKIGDLDYTKIRHYKTTITPEEMEYLRVDCLIVHHIVLYYIDKYGEMSKIPLTKTGITRGRLKNALDYKTKLKISKQQPQNIDDFLMLCSCFIGGVTHAVAINTDIIIEDVKSKDIVSSYPAVMLHEKYPARFSPISDFNTDHTEYTYNNKYAYLLQVKFTNIKAKEPFTYLSLSKCENVAGVILDNGRVRYADTLTTRCTEIDLDIIRDFYKFDSIEIIEVWESYKTFLPPLLRRFLYELFCEKNETKQAMKKEEKENGKDTEKYKDLEFVYNVINKPAINSMYGINVTNTIKDEVFINAFGDWAVKALTAEDVTEKLKAQARPHKSIVSFAWGVYVTAYARKKLMQAVKLIGEDVVYCDTDSVKYIGDHEKEFDLVNAPVQEYNKNLCELFEFDPDIIGNLGEFESEKPYKLFKTLGAKRYAYVHYDRDKVGYTVAGLPKGRNILKSLDDFHDGKVFDENESGKIGIYYNDNQEPLTVTDYLGNTVEITDRKTAGFMPTTFDLSITNDFRKLIFFLQEKDTTSLSLLGEYETLQTKLNGG